jgi:glyoxylase-like metal-dependent hydrolase (beta-lactamase superfamily II)
MSVLASGQLDVLQPGVRRLVANNPGYMTGPGTNTYLIGRERFFVLDPGPVNETHLERILEHTRGNIAGVLATHTHGDHSPGAAVLAARVGAPLLGRAAPAGARQDETFKPTRELADGESLQIDDIELKALHTPGHASNHVCFLVPHTGLLFTGDHVMQGSTVVIAPPDGDMGAYLASLRRLQGEAVAALAPGHGTVVSDAQAEIARVIAHRLTRENKVAEAVAAARSATLADLLLKVYADVDPRLHGLARQSLLAHLIKLRADERVGLTGDQDTGTWHWLG